MPPSKSAVFVTVLSGSLHVTGCGVLGVLEYNYMHLFWENKCDLKLYTLCAVHITNMYAKFCSDILSFNINMAHSCFRVVGTLNIYSVIY